MPNDQDPGFPWLTGTATGIGSMPGTDPAEAMRIVAGELPDFPYLPELPGRGPGADLTGRTAALLVDIPVEVTPRGWRLAEHPGRDLTRAKTMLSTDLDVAEEVLDGYRGPLKIQICGPWTLAATLELPRTLNMAVADPGAVADLTASLAEGAARHVAELQKRIPHAELIVQLDEPALPAVATGQIPTASGLSRLPAIEADPMQERLGQVIAAVGSYPLVHCCAQSVPFGLIRAAGAAAVAFDLGQLRRGEEEGVAESAEAGMGVLVGALDTRSGRTDVTAAPQSPVRAPGINPSDGSDAARRTAERVIRLWQRMGLSLDSLPAQAVITPACGLAAYSPAGARGALTRCREAGSMLAELIEETAGESR